MKCTVMAAQEVRRRCQLPYLWSSLSDCRDYGGLLPDRWQL